MYESSLSAELRERAKKEFNEDPERCEEDIEHIRQWIQEQPHLHIRTDTKFILRFLRGYKFSLEKTKKRLDLHFSLKASLPEWFKDRDVEEEKTKELLKKGIILPLKSDDTTSRIFIFRQGIYDPRRYTLNDVLRALFLLFDVFCEIDEVYQINGIIVIVDQQNLSMNHMLQYSPTQIKNVLKIWQDAYALQNKRLYIIHHGKIFHFLFKVAKLFMSKETLQILQLCGSDLKLMYDEVPKNILPKEYGGDAESVQEIIDYWLEVIASNSNVISEDNNNFVDESKRPK